MCRSLRWIAAALLIAAIVPALGCVRRTISVTTTPPGAIVFLNDREVGRTPCDVDFLHYGVYDIRLRLEGYEPVVGSGRASAPVWDFVGADFFAELVPAQLESRVEWHFDLEPSTRDAGALRVRASEMRAQSDALFAASADVPAADKAPGAPAPELSTPAGAAEGQGALPGKAPAEVPMPPDASVPAVPGQAPAPPR
jgi:hypothetical protein